MRIKPYFMAVCVGLGLSLSARKSFAQSSKGPIAMAEPQKIDLKAFKKTLSPVEGARAGYVFSPGALDRPYFEQNKDVLIHPASLTKLATAFAYYECLKSGKLDHCTQDQFSKMDTALRRMLIYSSNESAQDVAMFLAEEVGGASPAADKKTKIRIYAERVVNPLLRDQVGLEKTAFWNASGLEGRGTKYRSRNNWRNIAPTNLNVTTVHELARLAEYIFYHHPEILDICAEPEITFENKDGRVTKTNSNPLLWNSQREFEKCNEAVCAGKTGYISKAKYNLFTVAQRGEDIVMVVSVGNPNKQERINHVNTLISKAFEDINQGRMEQIDAWLERWHRDNASIPETLPALKLEPVYPQGY